MPEPEYLENLSLSQLKERLQGKQPSTFSPFIGGSQSRGTANRGLPSDGQELKRIQMEALLSAREGMQMFEDLRNLGPAGPMVRKLQGFVMPDQIELDRAEARRLMAEGDVNNALAVASGFGEYYRIHKEGEKIGALAGEQAAVMMGQATGFNQLMETIGAEERSGKQLQGVARVLRGVEAGSRLVNTVTTVAGGVGTASGALRGGLPFSAERQMNRAVAESVEETRGLASPPSTRAPAPQKAPVNTFENRNPELPSLRRADPPPAKARTRGTDNSIKAAPPAGKNVQRGLSSAQPKKQKSKPPAKKTKSDKTQSKPAAAKPDTKKKAGTSKKNPSKKKLDDIGDRFQIKPRWREGDFEYEEISGELGVPGKVATHRSRSAQRTVSKGTGEHGGHDVGAQFGPPGDARNVKLQNPNINTRTPKEFQDALGSGGSNLDLELDFTRKLKGGTKIWVRVRDKFRIGESRPISKRVDWIETTPDGEELPTQTLIFGNFSSPQSRAAGGF